MKMRKRILIAVIVALMVGFSCGAALYATEFLSDIGSGWKASMAGGFTLLDEGTIQDDGLPGGPPGTPG